MTKALISALPMIFCLSLLATTADAAHELNDRDIASGERLYEEHCAACHGFEMEGQPNWKQINEDGTMPAPPHDQTGHTWHHDNVLLFDYTRLGGEAALAKRGVAGFKSGMHGFSEVIPDDGIWDILAYIRSTWPSREQDIQAARNPPHD